MKTRLRHMGIHVPAATLTNHDLAEEFPEWSVDKISDKTGIVSRHVASPGETSLDLAVAACENLFKTAPQAREKIDFIVLCTQTPDYLLPTSACMLQHRIELPTTVGAMDINLGCSGYVYALATVKGLISSGAAHNALLVCTDTYSKLIAPNDKSNRVLFGDGASATWVSDHGEGLQIGDFVFGTDGSGFDQLIVPNSGMKTDHWQLPQSRNHPNVPFQSEDCLQMDGPGIFSFAGKQVPKLVARLLDQTGKSIDEIDRFIFHQANRYMLEHLRRRLKIPAEKFVVELENFGNTVSSSIPFAIHESIAKNPFRPGDTALLAGFGVGLSMSACTLTYKS